MYTYSHKNWPLRLRTWPPSEIDVQSLAFRLPKKRLRQTGKGVEKQDEMLGGLAVGRSVRGLLSTEQPGRWNCGARGAREDAVRWRAKCARYFAGPRLSRGRGYPEAA